MNIPLIDEILRPWQKAIGKDHQAYVNHVHRVVHFCLGTRAWDDASRKKIIIAAAFHDLGIWSDDTFDYLAPSIALATQYLHQNGLDAWAPEVARMIALHHKVRPVHDGEMPLVETFRRSDLVDLSLGLLKFDLPADVVRRVRSEFPNAGFHLRLLQLTAKRFRHHPLSPVPVLRW
jgi:predicted metal-dependent HD superfamily phosphohydrolase